MILDGFLLEAHLRPGPSSHKWLHNFCEPHRKKTADRLKTCKKITAQLFGSFAKIKNIFLNFFARGKLRNNLIPAPYFKNPIFHRKFFLQDVAKNRSEIGPGWSWSGWLLENPGVPLILRQFWQFACMVVLADPGRAFPVVDRYYVHLKAFKTSLNSFI